MAEFDLQIAAIKVADRVQNEGADLPPHLLELLALREYESIGELVDDIASADETEREAIWEKADRCALMRALIPYNLPDGRISKVGRKVVGWLASDLRVSGQTVRRYMGLGYYFPPEVKQTDEETGEVRTVVVRDPATPINVYYAALTAEKYNLDPLEAVLHALENELTAGQLKKWIQEERYRRENEIPPIKREWFSDAASQPDLNTLKAMLDDAWRVVEAEFKRLAERPDALHRVSISVKALEAAEDLLDL